MVRRPVQHQVAAELVGATVAHQVVVVPAAAEEVVAVLALSHVHTIATRDPVAAVAVSPRPFRRRDQMASFLGRT